MIVVSDEIHGDLMLEGRPHYPFASVSDEAAKVAVTLGAPSKTFNIAGLVSSWCVIKDEALREGFFRWLQVNEFDAPTFVAIYGPPVAQTQLSGQSAEQHTAARRFIFHNFYYRR